ncbi:MAG: hypothetical protein RBR06_03550 [Desulfuromonadaceae bacterium]|nr:hypothetical protein [Desulfuromonadaceae bacterium]
MGAGAEIDTEAGVGTETTAGLHSASQPDSYIDLYRRTLASWGEQAQYDQSIEECAELSVALLHYRRAKASRQAVIDEMADVILMLGQLRWMFGSQEVDLAVERKRAKLERLLCETTASDTREDV